MTTDSASTTATLRLWHRSPSRSTRVLWLLEELGDPYELELVGVEARDDPEHRGRHPLGRVPVIAEEGGYVFESVAICLHLADLHPEAGLIPPVGTHERALAYQWTIFSVTEVEDALMHAEAWRDVDEERFRASGERLASCGRAIEDALGDAEYIVEGRFSVADVLLGSSLIYAKRLGLFGPLEGLPHVVAYTERLEARPARQRAAAM